MVQPAKSSNAGLGGGLESRTEPQPAPQAMGGAIVTNGVAGLPEIEVELTSLRDPLADASRIRYASAPVVREFDDKHSPSPRTAVSPRNDGKSHRRLHYAAEPAARRPRPSARARQATDTKRAGRAGGIDPRISSLDELSPLELRDVNGRRDRMAQSVQFLQYQAHREIGQSRDWSDKEALVQERANRHSGPSTLWDKAGTLWKVARFVGLRDAGAHGAGQVARFAARFALAALAATNAPATVAAGGVVVVTGVYAGLTASNAIADLVGIKHWLARGAVHSAPMLLLFGPYALNVVVPIAALETLGVDLIADNIGKTIAAVWLRDPITQAVLATMEAPSVELRELNDKRELVEIGSEATRSVDVWRTLGSGALYGIYFWYFRDIAAAIQEATLGIDEDLAANGTVLERLGQQLGTLITTIIKEMLDGAQASVWLLPISLFNRYEYRLKYSTPADREAIARDFKELVMAHGGMRQNIGFMETVVEFLRNTSDESWTMVWRGLAAAIHATWAETRGTFVKWGRAEQARARGEQGKLASGGDTAISFYQTVSVVAGDKVARERARLGLPPIGSRVRVGQIDCNIATSPGDMNKGVERLEVNASDVETVIAELRECHPAAEIDFIKVAGAESGYVRIPRKAAPTDWDDSAGSFRFYPTKSFHYGPASCTVVDNEIDPATGKKMVIFSTPATLKLQLVRPADERTKQNVYKVREEDLRNMCAAFMPMATGELCSGCMVRLLQAECEVLAYGDQGIDSEGNRDVRVLLASKQPIEALSDKCKRSGEYVPNGGDRSLKLWSYELTKDEFAKLRAVVVPPPADSKSESKSGSNSESKSAGNSRDKAAAAALPELGSPGVLRKVHIRKGDVLLFGAQHAVVQQQPDWEARGMKLRSSREIPGLARFMKSHGWLGPRWSGWNYEMSYDEAIARDALPISSEGFVVGSERMKLKEDPESGDTWIMGSNPRVNQTLLGLFGRPDAPVDGARESKAMLHGIHIVEDPPNPTIYVIPRERMERELPRLRLAIEAEDAGASAEPSGADSPPPGRMFFPDSLSSQPASESPSSVVSASASDSPRNANLLRSVVIDIPAPDPSPDPEPAAGETRTLIADQNVVLKVRSKTRKAVVVACSYSDAVKVMTAIPGVRRRGIDGGETILEIDLALTKPLSRVSVDGAGPGHDVAGGVDAPGPAEPEPMHPFEDGGS